MDDEDVALERVTLQLVNMIAYGSSSRVHSRRLRLIAGIDLPPSDIRMIEFLAGHEPLALSLVATELGLDLGQCSRQASALEALGHVSRRTDPTDRRRTLVSLSSSTLELMDKWLLDWSSGYAVPTAAWRPQDVRALTRWFRLVLDRLEDALPSLVTSPLPGRWAALSPADEHSPELHEFLASAIELISWVGQSGGFNEILEYLEAPIRQHGWFTLRVVAGHGPLSIADVAERMAIDPSQASKRLSVLTELGLVDRKPDAYDRRTSLVRLSKAGAKLDQRVRQWQLESFSAIVHPIKPGDRRRWTALMSRYMDELTRAAVDSDRWAGLDAQTG